MRIIWPLALTTLLFCALVMGQIKPESGTPGTVVFVCEHGAAKSIIAAAEFNRLAEQKGVPERAISRGTNPDSEFAAAVVAGLRKDGLTVPVGKPQAITPADLKTAERVVTLGCKLPQQMSSARKPADWSDITSPSLNYDSARKDIARHVQQLVDELAQDRAAK